MPRTRDAFPINFLYNLIVILDGAQENQYTLLRIDEAAEEAIREVRKELSQHVVKMPNYSSIDARRR